MTLSRGREIVLRRAADDDWDMLFGLANDPVARANSIQTQAIAFDDHVEWFEAALGNPAHHLLIAELDGRAVGMVRLDITDDDPETAVISINLVPRLRGMGLGKIALKAATEAAPAMGLQRIIAYIRPENQRSVRAFSGAGFILGGESEIRGISMLRYETTSSQE